MKRVIHVSPSKANAFYEHISTEGTWKNQCSYDQAHILIYGVFCVDFERMIFLYQLHKLDEHLVF